MEDRTKVYTAFTLGPIIGTILKAYRTKEIWLASYIFSQLMHDVIEEIQGSDSYKAGEIKILTPYEKLDKVFKTNDNSILSPGIYPDRLFLESTKGQGELIDSCVQKAIDNLATDIKKTINGEDEIATQLKEYIYYHIIEGNSKPEVDNPIAHLGNILANQERGYHHTNRDHELIARYFELCDQASDNYIDKYGAKIPSLSDICIQGGDTRSSQYVCVVHADGDRIGSLISQIDAKSSSDYNKFSYALGEYCKSAAQIIKDEGGFPIYLSGDDLLWFHPVINENGVSVFDLINRLDIAFNEKIVSGDVKNIVESMDGTPSMSYGLTISYHKHPMYEMMKSSYEKLGIVKKRGENNERIYDSNLISFQLMKHSGQTIQGVFKKDTIPDLGIKPALNSVLYSLNAQRDLLIYLLRHNREGTKLTTFGKQRLQAFFDNNYNETTHDVERAFFDEVIIMLEKYMDKVNPKKSVEENAIDSVINLLYLNKFLNQSKHEEDGK